MRTLLLVTLILNLIGCGDGGFRSNSPLPPIKISAELSEYHSRFIEYSAIALGRPASGRINLVFEDLNYDSDRGGINGRCILSLTEPPRIEIDLKFWAQASDARRENLIFHEFGHCALKRPHLDVTDRYGVPVSIMYPYTMTSITYLARRTELILELFLGIAKERESGEFFSENQTFTTSDLGLSYDSMACEHSTQPGAK